MVKINKMLHLNRKQYATCSVNGMKTFEFTVARIGVYRLFSSLVGATNGLQIVLSVS